MTDAEALDLVRVWWAKSTHLLNNTANRGFRPNLEPTKFGWAVWLRGAGGWYVEGKNLFSGHTVAEAVETARPAVEALLDGD
jgi:hypothetical protein